MRYGVWGFQQIESYQQLLITFEDLLLNRLLNYLKF
jgi:hypothetical protein